MFDSYGVSLRDLFIAAMIVLPIFAVGNLAWGAKQIKGFLEMTGSVDTDRHMQRFKQVVATQMYCALFQIGFLAVPIVLLGLGYATKTLHDMDFLFVLVPSILILAYAAYVKVSEKNIMALPVSDRLREEFDRVVNTWLHKPFPDW